MTPRKRDETIDGPTLHQLSTCSLSCTTRSPSHASPRHECTATSGPQGRQPTVSQTDGRASHRPRYRPSCMPARTQHQPTTTDTKRKGRYSKPGTKRKPETNPRTLCSPRLSFKRTLSSARCLQLPSTSCRTRCSPYFLPGTPERPIFLASSAL